MTVLNLIVIGLLIVSVLCAGIFAMGVRRKGGHWPSLISSYLRHLAVGAGLGVMVSVAAVFGVTAYYNSSQGPLALIVLGPLAFAVGALVGSLRWLTRKAR